VTGSDPVTVEWAFKDEKIRLGVVF